MRVETGEASEFCGADSYAAPAVDHSAASKIPLAYDDDVILSDGAFQSGLFHLNTLAENLHAFVGAKLRQSTAACDGLPHAHASPDGIYAGRVDLPVNEEAFRVRNIDLVPSGNEGVLTVIARCKQIGRESCRDSVCHVG